MPYKIALRVYQTNPCRGFFHIVEKTCWNYSKGGTWSETDGIHTLTMGDSGTPGVLRFVPDRDERITVAVGVHDGKRWCDVVTGLASDETALVVNGQYYNNGMRAYMREKQSAEHSVASDAGTKVKVVYTVADGKNLRADIVFG